MLKGRVSASLTSDSLTRGEERLSHHDQERKDKRRQEKKQSRNETHMKGLYRPTQTRRNVESHTHTHQQFNLLYSLGRYLTIRKTCI